MDSGELDFYQHTKLCSNTCRSTKIDLVGTRASLSSQTSTETAPTPSSTDGTTPLYTYPSFRSHTDDKPFSCSMQFDTTNITQKNIIALLASSMNIHTQFQ